VIRWPITNKPEIWYNSIEEYELAADQTDMRIKSSGYLNNQT